MSEWQPSAYKDYRWIVADQQLLGGKLAIRGTRLSVSLILDCLAGGMSMEEIDESVANAFPHEALAEVLKVAAELALKPGVHTAALRGLGRGLYSMTYLKKERKSWD